MDMTDKRQGPPAPDIDEELADAEERLGMIEDDSDEVIEIDEAELMLDGADDPEVAEPADPETVELPDASIDSVIMADEIVLSKHTAEGKHSLKYDSIFKGRRDEADTDDDFERMATSETFEVDKSSYYWVESIDNENYVKDKRVKERVYEVLEKHTDLNFLNNRRKPSKSDFNKYYFILKTHLKGESFTNVELFNELSVYFSDNLFNMFKLLDNKWRNLIIGELQDHIGKNVQSSELMPRNIHKGTEIEFEWPTDGGQVMLITGVVTEVDYDARVYVVDSYESVYDVEYSRVTKILNNAKFKYNLNKLNNIDFL